MSFGAAPAAGTCSSERPGGCPIARPLVGTNFADSCTGSLDVLMTGTAATLSRTTVGANTADSQHVNLFWQFAPSRRTPASGILSFSAFVVCGGLEF